MFKIVSCFFLPPRAWLLQASSASTLRGGLQGLWALWDPPLLRHLSQRRHRGLQSCQSHRLLSSLPYTSICVHGGQPEGRGAALLRAPFQAKTWDLESDRPGLRFWLSPSLAPRPCTSAFTSDSLSVKWAGRQEAVHLSASGRLEGQSLPRV